MDVGVCAGGGDGTKRRVDLAGAAEGTMEVVPLEMYDSARAKIDANLRWLFAKAYGIDHIPEDLRDPFYTDQYEQEHIKPPVLQLLLSCELYCRVCALILDAEQAAALRASHLSVIQALSRKGIYVVESDDAPVTEADLASVPIKMSAHMPMIDALMMAYTVEMISIEKVVACVKRFSTFSASKELPFDLEDAMVFWINKVNMKMRDITEREHKVKQHPLESPSHQKVRYRREHASGRQLPFFPLLEDLTRDVCDGAALLTVVHYYCPDLMKLEDICLKEVPSIADSLYNIQLLKEFASEYLNRSFYLRTEDVLYSPLVLKHNVMVFIAELFWWFEIVKPDFVQPRDPQEFKDARAMAQCKSGRPSVPISNATKRSFLASPGVAETQASPEVCNRYFLHPEDSADALKGAPTFSPSHPLLPLRQRQQKQQGDEGAGLRNRSNSLTQMEGQTRGSVVAWPEKRQRPVSTLSPYAFPSAADSGDADSVSLARSISKDSLASNVVNVTPKHQAPPPPQARRINGHGILEDETLVAVARTDPPAAVAAAAAALTSKSTAEEEAEPAATDSFYLEPLMPAVLKPAKEKSACPNKEEESGEAFPPRSSGRGSLRRGGDSPAAAVRRKALPGAAAGLNRTFSPPSGGEELDPPTADPPPPPPRQRDPLLADPSSREPPGAGGGFYLHSSDSEEQQQRPELPELLGEVDEEEDEEEDLDEALTCAAKNDAGDWIRKTFDAEEEESAKLQEDMNVKEHKDKDLKDWVAGSGRSSPSCLSTQSSQASGSVRMTSFAERKAAAQQHRLLGGSNHDLRGGGGSSASSSQRTTPDGSECSGPLAAASSSSWRMRPPRDQSPSSPLANNNNNVLVASELVQLHMQLEEKRRAIEHQKKKMEALSARQRQKLGKAAFLHVVKKGGKSDTLPNPLLLKADLSKDESEKVTASSKDDLCVGREAEVVVVAAAVAPPPPPNSGLDVAADRKGGGGGSFYLDEELDLNECNRSIELLNDAIGSIQQQMMQLSLQQEMLMKQNVVVQSPPGGAVAGPPPPPPPSSDKVGGGGDAKVRAPVHFTESLSATGSVPARKPPKLSSARGGGGGSRSKPSELKIAKEQGGRQGHRGRSPRAEQDPPSPRTPTTTTTTAAAATETIGGATPPPGSGGHHRSATFRLQDEANLRLPTRVDLSTVAAVARAQEEVSFDECLSSTMRGETTATELDSSGMERAAAAPSEEMLLQRSKAPLIEVDLSELKADDDGDDTDGGDGEQKSGMGFFFKDEQKAEDELAKKRAAFLLKQQKKAEEARLRKQQLEVEAELKRDEVRRKAEEDRLRKEEEKTRRELIKQEYLRRKQQEILEEQGLLLAKPKMALKAPCGPKAPKTPKQKHRPVKSVFSREESSGDSFSSKCPSSSAPDNLSTAQSGSSLSLASATTNEADSVNSGGTGSQRCDSVESFPGSRNTSRVAERDWDNGSTASSITSMAEYTGPKLFKEPSAKSNKPIIHNAIAHCCLAGKVNEPQKNQILEELEKCESNHLMILFRDGGCQFRALYSFFPDTEEIAKLTGTGPKSIGRKMIDKLYKYSSDRKQFTVIPAKTVSVSVDALTIHNHLWQAKRGGGTVPKKSAK